MGRTVKCPQCGDDYIASQQARPQKRPKHKTGAKPIMGQKAPPGVVVSVVAVGLVFLIGNFHVISGGSVGPKVVPRESFGFSEIFINVDKITGMPWIAAKTKYPLGCIVLAREGIIESDSQFKDRINRETQEEIDKAMERSQKEYDDILRRFQE